MKQYSSIPSRDDAKIIVNMSRVSARGTGQSLFSRQVLGCLTQHFNGVAVVAGDGFEVPGDLQVRRVPSWVTMSHGLSKVRPLLWLLYSYARLSSVKGRVFSTTAHPLPRVKEQIVCVLDVRPYFHPDGILQKIYSRFLLRRSLSSAASIVTISMDSKRAIAEAYRFPADRIHVVPLIVDVSKFQPADGKQRDDARPYLLMVGATWKHKNAEEVLSNCELWRHKYELKIVAGQSPYRTVLEDVVAQRGIQERVKFIDYVTQDELISLYQRASALIYPSVMEGFGIPPLEAMASGTPAIVSDIPVFREVYGSAALYVRLKDSQSWRTAFQELESAPRRVQLREAGLCVSKSYTAERMASALVAAIVATWPETRNLLNCGTDVAVPANTSEKGAAPPFIYAPSHS